VFVSADFHQSRLISINLKKVADLDHLQRLSS
jgi:hypothetical protein